MTLERIPWNQYFMAQSVLLALRSTCTRLEVGATIVRDKRIIAGGYNGSVSGDVHCVDEDCYVVDGHCVANNSCRNECCLAMCENLVSQLKVLKFMSHIFRVCNVQR